MSGQNVDPMAVIQSNVKSLLGAMQVKAKVAGHTLVLSMSIGGWSMINVFYETAVSDSIKFSLKA